MEQKGRTGFVSREAWSTSSETCCAAHVGEQTEDIAEPGAVASAGPLANKCIQKDMIFMSQSQCTKRLDDVANATVSQVSVVFYAEFVIKLLGV